MAGGSQTRRGDGVRGAAATAVLGLAGWLGGGCQVASVTVAPAAANAARTPVRQQQTPGCSGHPPSRSSTTLGADSLPAVCIGLLGV